MKAQTTTSTTSTQRATRHAIKTALLSLALLVAGCGGGGGGSAPAVNGVANNAPTQSPVAANAFAVTGDSYGMQNPTYLASTKSTLGIVLRSALATSMTDPNFKTVSRIDIAPGAAITPAVVYSLGPATGANPAFPGDLYFLNGHPSTLLSTVDGTITFTSFDAATGGRISGSFNAIIEDGNDSASPKARYSIAANFDFTTDSFGPVASAAPASTQAAGASYDANCASCHSLGSYDSTGTAGDLALKGGKLGTLFSAGQPGHQGLSLSANDISGLKVLLNSN